jgi:hypothetical protein
MSRFILERYGCFWKDLSGKNYYSNDEDNFETSGNDEVYEVVNVISEDEVEVDIKK